MGSRCICKDDNINLAVNFCCKQNFSLVLLKTPLFCWLAVVTVQVRFESVVSGMAAVSSWFFSQTVVTTGRQSSRVGSWDGVCAGSSIYRDVSYTSQYVRVMHRTTLFNLKSYYTLLCDVDTGRQPPQRHFKQNDISVAHPREVKSKYWQTRDFAGITGIVVCCITPTFDINNPGVWVCGPVQVDRTLSECGFDTACVCVRVPLCVYSKLMGLFSITLLFWLI